MVATSSTCYDVFTFLTQRGKSASNFVAISSLVVILLKNNNNSNTNEDANGGHFQHML